MNYFDFVEKLQMQIKRKVTHDEIADILSCSRANISKKILNKKSEVTISDLIKIEDYFGISLLTGSMPSPERIISRDSKLACDISKWGVRLDLIAKYNGLSDSEMAKILNIKESRYNSIVLKGLEPKISELNAIKSNFNINIDYLLYDENGFFESFKQKLYDDEFRFNSLSPREKEAFKKFLKKY